MKAIMAKEIAPEQEGKDGKQAALDTEHTQNAVLGEGRYFRDQNHVPYAAIYNGKRVVVCPIESDDCTDIIEQISMRKTGTYPDEKNTKEIQYQMKLRAKFGGVNAKTHVRYAGGNDLIYVDLCNENGDIVVITPEGWHIKQQDLNPPFFMRNPAMLPLPLPVKGGDISKLAEFTNSTNEYAFILLSSILIGYINPDGPYPVMMCHGPHGSAKSTIVYLISELIDPSKAALAALPASERDLFIAADRSHLLCFDNVFKVPQKIADGLCRVSTGGVFRTRKLYKNTQETLISAINPIIINGIGDYAHQNDLLDRTISVLFDPISPERRRPLKTIIRQFEQAKPSILGALYAAVSTALRNLPQIKLVRHSRMADFELFVVAAEPACPWENGKFLEAYENNRTEIIETAIEIDPVAEAVRKLMEDKGNWSGTPTDLHNELKLVVRDETKKLPEWPKSPVALSNSLQRLQGFLSTKGVDIERKRLTDRRLIILTKKDGGAVEKDPMQDDMPPVTATDDEPFGLSETNQKGVSAAIISGPDRPPAGIETESDREFGEVG